MPTEPQQQKRREVTLSSLNAAIEALNIMKEATTATPAPAVFGTVSVLLTMIRVRFSSSLPTDSELTSDQDSMTNKTDYIEIGLACANVCRALDRGIDGRRLDELSRSVGEAIEQLTTWVKPATMLSVIR